MGPGVFYHEEGRDSNRGLLAPFPQRSKNRRECGSPNGFSGTARRSLRAEPGPEPQLGASHRSPPKRKRPPHGRPLPFCIPGIALPYFLCYDTKKARAEASDRRADRSRGRKHDQIPGEKQRSEKRKGARERNGRRRHGALRAFRAGRVPGRKIFFGRKA